jgi:hypothetical protein
MKFEPHFCIKTFYVFIPIVFLLIPGTPAPAQLLSVVDSKMTFTSDAELELITASSGRVQGLIDPATNEFAFHCGSKVIPGIQQCATARTFQ